jgi:hypothetical protein
MATEYLIWKKPGTAITTTHATVVQRLVKSIRGLLIGLRAPSLVSTTTRPPLALTLTMNFAAHR